MGALRKAGVWLGLVEDDDELEYDDPAYDKSYSPAIATAPHVGRIAPRTATRVTGPLRRRLRR